MATEFRLPELGENIETGQVLTVHVSVGDVIEKDQPVVEIETDKAAIEVPSEVAGRVSEIRVSEGDEVEVGQVLLLVEESGDQASGSEAESAPQEEAAATEEASDETGAVAESHEPQTAKDAVQPPAEPAAEQEDGSQEGGSEQRGPEAGAEGPRLAPSPGGGAKAATVPESKGEPAPAAPSVRRFAREVGVDIHQVEGRGPGGRISREDVKRHVKQALTGQGNQGAGAQQGGGAVLPSVPLPDFSQWGEVEREPLSRVRATIARNLSAAWVNIPHVTQHDKADVTSLEGVRKTYAPKAEERGGKLTVTAILLKVAALALQVFPRFNSSLDMASGELIRKQYINIGLAVDTDRGLLVPVIRDVDQKSILELSVEIQEAAERARNRKTSLEEMQGGTFTVTNLGGIGGTSFTPIINAPEVAILGVSRTRTEPVWRHDGWEPRKLLPLSLSYDHRVIDGADGARFLRWVCDALEKPLLTLLEQG